MTEPRVALVTGGARGIGRGIARALGERGWEVAVCYRTSAADGATLVYELARLGRRALAVRADVADPAAVAALVAEVEAKLGRIDALVHCAGPYHRVDVLEETAGGWREMLETNLDSLFHCARAVVPGMMARGWGRIVGFSMASAERLQAQPNLTAHYIAKVGVLALVRTLARRLAPHGITANAISPGFIASGSADEAGEHADVHTRIPAGYVGSIDDVVAAALYLLSDEARYVNGTNLVLSGGWGV